MDGTTRYRLAIEQLVFELDPDSPEPIDSQLQSAMKAYLQAAAHRRLVLAQSQTPTAQSFRNYLSRQNSPERWALMALRQDAEQLLGFRLTGQNDRQARRTLAQWRTQQLRHGFEPGTPWCVIADWNAENGDMHKSQVCRRLAQHSQTP